MEKKIEVKVASIEHNQFVDIIIEEMAAAAAVRGTGIARRKPEYIAQKIKEGKAIIATKGDEFVGFCYIESWGHGKYVANSGLIVVEKYRNHGVAKQIKKKAFELSQKKYPDAKIFGITTSLAVMKINSELGYKPVTFSELTDDEEFWKGCQSCVNFDILTRTQRKHCLCAGMLYDPKTMAKKKPVPLSRKMLKIYERWLRLKQHVFLMGKKSRAGEITKNIQKKFTSPFSKQKKENIKINTD